MYANFDFETKKQFVKAVQQGEPVVLWSPTMGVPAINGIVTVENWPSTTQDLEHWVHGMRVNEVGGWRVRVRVQDMHVKEVLG